MPSHILLCRPWLQQRPVAAVTVALIDIHGRILIRTNNVNIGLQPGSTIQCISLDIVDWDAFDTMLDLTATPPQRVALTLWR